VICGHDDHWNRLLMNQVRHHVNLVDHFSIHRYWVNGGPGVEFSEEQYYALLKEADETEQFILTTDETIKAVAGNRKIGIALDEWGVWHPEARQWGPDSNGTMTDNYEQACTMRDALAAAAVLEVFHRQCDKLSIANLAQIVNVLQAPIATSGAHMWVTPTYYAFKLHAPHVGATALRTDVATHHLPNGRPAVTATSSQKDGKVSVTVINRHVEEAADVAINLPGKLQDAVLLTADSPRDQNSAENPGAVNTTGLSIDCSTGSAVFKLPPHSMATIELSC
jgi:alpha-N-arabinofuranosidase